MAITINQKPWANDDYPFTVSNADNIVRVNSSNVANPKFKFVIDVYIGGTTTADRVVRIKRSPNESNVAIVSLREVFRSYVESTPNELTNANYDISYYLPAPATNDFASENNNTAKFVRISVGEEYAASTTADPEVQSGSFVNSDGVVILGAKQFLESYSWDAEKYTLEKVLTPTSGYLLTEIPNREFIYDEEQHATIAFLNYDTPNSTPLDFDRVIIKYYDSSDTLLSNTTVLFSTLGINVTPAISGTTESELMIFLGIGPANLEQGDTTAIKPSQNTGWFYYTFQFFDNALEASQLYQVTKRETCSYEPVRLRFLNNQGSWDYFTFYLQDRPSYQVERKDLKKLYGSWNGSSYSYNPNERGAGSYDSMLMEEHNCFSDYISEDVSEWLKMLYSSREVYWLRDDLSFTDQDGITHDNWGVPVVITNTSYTPKKRLNDQLIKHDITFRFAHDIFSA